MDQAQITDTPLKKTPLNARHRASGGKMVPFGGWDMPVEYSGITTEHMAVRERAGVFDVSHMGEIEIAGKDALAAVQRISCNDASKLEVGQAQLSGLLTPGGTFVDDLLVYRLANQHFLLIVNASHIPHDYAHIVQHVGPLAAAVVDASSRYALLAVQGPRALEILQPLTGVDLGAIKYYWFAHGEVASVRATISRTGYTGEDGFEILIPPQSADSLWQAILEAGSRVDLIPCGLGARDTLRLEAGMRLHGNDMDETTTVLEAGLGWIVGWNKGDFIGAEALRKQKADGVTRKLVGFEMVERGIARHSYDVYVGDAKAGRVTSGTQTPYLKKAIGMAYLPVAHTVTGTEFDVDVRGRRTRATVVRCHSTSAIETRRPELLARAFRRSQVSYPQGFKYTKDHEWIDLDGDRGKIGITAFCATTARRCGLSRAPGRWRQTESRAVLCSIESVKAVSELFAPVSGEVVEVNTALKQKPESVNSDPHGSWMIVVKLSDPVEANSLLDATHYADLVK